MGITQSFESRGYDFNTATQAAERAMQGLVARQASVLMFEKLFLVSGIAFLFVLDDVPGATPKKPDSGLMAHRRPSGPGRSHAMSSPTVHTFHPFF